jgi:uncharacterized membrane protein YdjX (TVP38/TMEM64 family)
MSGSEAAAVGRHSSPVKRFAPLALLVLAIVLVFAFDLDRFVSFQSLSENREMLLGFVERNAFLAPLLYVLVYASVVALSIPGGAILTIAGGFLFGTWFGTVLVLIGATLGATLVFLIARTAIGDVLRDKAGPRIKKMEQGFQEDAFNYLLVLRLIPIFPFWLVNIVPAMLGVPLFPFWLVNLVPAFLGVPLRTYVVATFLGIIPGSFVYASVGNGLGAVFDTGGTPDLGIIFRPEIILPIVGLALLAVLPVAYRKFKGRPAA